MIKSIKERRTEWREGWIKKNVPEGVKYNPFIHKRIPVVPNLDKLIRYAEKLIKDGLDNETINGRLLKYRKTQLTGYDLDYFRLYYEVEKIEKDPKLKIRIENLEKNIRELIEERHKIHEDYLWNVQSPYLKIEEQMVKEHKHEYPEYMEFMEQKVEYKKNRVEIEIIINDSKKAINKIENDIYRRVREGYKKIEDWKVKRSYNTG